MNKLKKILRVLLTTWKEGLPMSRMSEWKQQCVKNVSLQKCGSSLLGKKYALSIIRRDHTSFYFVTDYQKILSN